MARVRVPLTVVDLSGNALAGASVLVQRRSSGASATLYQAETGATTVANPTSTDSAGRTTAWVDRGAYNGVISATGITTYTQPFDASAADDRAMDELWMPQGAVPLVVSSLPVSPVDGQEIYYVADATNGVVWHFRYRAASASTYKWELVGGSPAITEILTSETTTSTAWTDLATVGPQYVLPFAGDWAMQLGAQLSTSSAGSYVGVGLRLPGQATVNPPETAYALFSAAGISNEATKPFFRRNGLASGALLKLQYVASAGTGTVSNRAFTVLPIRVG